VRRSVLAFVITVLSACTSTGAPTPGIYFPIYSIGGGAVPAAELRGMLVLATGCLWIDTGAERFLALWPEGSELEPQTDPVRVVTPDGTSFEFGESIHVGGGEIADQDFLLTLLDTAPPKECIGQPGWLVTEGL